LFLPVLSFADNKVKLIPLEPIPRESSITPYKTNPRRPGYNMRGRVDSVRRDEIVINDTLRFLTSLTQVFSSADNTASKRILKPGKFVAFKLDRENRILKIKIIKK
ncbi:MAG: hypothetical protein GY834_17260, partial [Bacteroidetes bacterium]|nr:hypothetical protein [Bacteroidota bacterium]